MYTITSPVTTGHVCSVECEGGLPDRHAFAAFEVTCANPACAAVELLECQDDLVFFEGSAAHKPGFLGWQCPHCGVGSSLEEYDTVLVDPAVQMAESAGTEASLRFDERITPCERTRAWRRYQVAQLEAAAR